MSQTSVLLAGASGRYAAALFDLANEAGRLLSVEQELKALGALLKSDAGLKRLVESQAFSREQQGAAMNAVLVRAGASDLTKKLVGLMAAKGRLALLPDAISGYQALMAQHRNEAEAEVISARPLSPARAGELVKTLEASEGRKVTLKTSVDPGLLGGLIVKIGSKMIDASLRAKLSRLQLAMKEVGR